MREDVSTRLRKGHRRIVQFLEQCRSVVDEYLAPNVKAQTLLQYAVDFGLNPAKVTSEDLRKDFGSGYSPKSKVKDALNELLMQFSKDHQITPPIQMYFVSSELHKQIIHFACCRNERKAKSFGYVSLEELEDTLIKAEQALAGRISRERLDRICEEIEPRVREILRKEALENLREKLKPKDENDYMPLELEYGVLDRKKEESQSAYVDNLQEEFAHNRKWKRFGTNELLKAFGIYILSSNVGTGKTMFLRHLQLQLLNKKDRVPIFIRASKIEEWEPENVGELARHLARGFYPELEEKSVF
jgi:hypothetical protein